MGGLEELRWKEDEVSEMVSKSIVEVGNPLSNTDIYCGQLEHGGHAITYVGASEESCMLGKRLKRGKGVSFTAIDSGKLVLVRNDTVFLFFVCCFSTFPEHRREQKREFPHEPWCPAAFATHGEGTQL